MTASTTDTALGFSIPGRNARGRIVRIGPVLDEVLEAHAYPKPLAQLLGEALVLAALFGSTLKEAGGQLTIQAQTQNGVVELLVADYKGGELRGYVRHDPERLAAAPVDPSLFSLFGQGYLAITFDQAVTGERYQGIVPLEGESLAEAAEHYFVQSEQIPSLIRISVKQHENGRWVAGGMLLQHLAEGEEGRERLHVRLDHPEWEHIRTLGETVTDGELANPELALDALIWRLFHDEGEIRVLPQSPLGRGCRCDPVHIRQVVSQFSAEEHAEMADKDGVIRVDCEFCARSFPIEVAEL
ncbi:Hsp33 family molecular chaperone HslO [Parasphingopyxis sp. CP4]|uniref:Hsp33 family molecular chaperone HslO n=1 Tax=Parasphingopyxis sp. CP4 TaxID=2724527 RepID=UPI0015A3A78D|nr:Hsp33 family molecular chaperone HslO [Parasphingopyxis sp. CP4]QLC23432.1 Hsp33 family molecular chaperone HslO [Parasphingopyxis sp. CP4]